MQCPKCKKEVELNDENIIVSIGAAGVEKKVEVELICDNKKCGETVGFAFVGESEFTESA